MQIRAKSSPLVKALAKKLEGGIAIAQANIDVFLEQSVGVGEHSDVVKAIETNVEALASADEKLQILKKLYGV